MPCGFTVETDYGHVGCGQCLNCRIAKRRVWTARILLEAQTTLASSFITLTYADEHVPTELDASATPHLVLNPQDFTKFLKRLRHHLPPFRYFGVGEYGTRTQRPHYHAVIFGMDAGMLEGPVLQAWKRGYIQVDALNEERAAYIAGYVVKKWSKDSEALHGRPPEFQRSSRNPPIGGAGADRLADAMFSRSGSAGLAATVNVPDTVEIGGKEYPLGWAMRNRMYKRLGAPESSRDRHVLMGQPLPFISKPTDEVRIHAYKTEAREIRREKRRGTF